MVKLHKAIYGLKSSTKAWYEELTNYLLDNEYLQSKTDPCVMLTKDYDLIMSIHVIF